MCGSVGSARGARLSHCSLQHAADVRALQARYIEALQKKAQFREKEQERIYERLQRKEADNDRETCGPTAVVLAARRTSIQRTHSVGEPNLPGASAHRALS